MTETYESYNPLDYKNLTRNLVNELMARAPVQMPVSKKFHGPGVYALFYKGDSPLYTAVSSHKLEQPIYVGQAGFAGRTGIKETKNPLYDRLAKHGKSIEAASETLKINDFMCRYLVVEPLWIEMSEQFLIEHYQPVWNVCLYGFGNNDPGKERATGLIPMWDCLHAGREWSKKLKPRDPSILQEQLRKFFEKRKSGGKAH